MNIFKLKIAFLTIVAAFLSCAELNAQSNTFTSLIEKIHPESYETLTEQATARKKNYILCSTYASSDKRNKPCFADSFNFTFSAIFHDKNLVKQSKLKSLAQTLGEYSTCEIRYMKHNTETGIMEYFRAGENFYWYEGKKLNETMRPEVFISSVNNRDNRKKITFKCSLPKSDVELSLSDNSNVYKPMQSHPASGYTASVSATHIRLNFMHIENINIYMSKYKSTDLEDGDDTQKQFASQNLIKRSAERFLIYYDEKCKTCTVNEPIYKPSDKSVLMCDLKQNTCENKGKCYSNKEIDASASVNDDEMPRYNLFVCNPEFSQTNLYMPCAINNGGCQFNQTCLFDAKSLLVACQ